MGILIKIQAEEGLTVSQLIKKLKILFPKTRIYLIEKEGIDAISVYIFYMSFLGPAQIQFTIKGVIRWE